MITVDDVLDVAEQKATEEIQGLGGVEALEAPYFDVSMASMIKKRGGWLSALFLGEMLTATAMSAFEDEIAKAVVLSLFLPLIISSGGNSGSQATSIIIRSLALREVKLRDWWRVASREVCPVSRSDASWDSSGSSGSSSGRRCFTCTASTSSWWRSPSA
jgi:magnesium transporter